MNKIGCRPLVGFTHRVRTSSTAARRTAFQFSAARPVMPLLSRATPATLRPAAATMAAEAGRRP